MRTVEILKAWGHILRGHAPSLSLEITRECPLRCPGCYAYEEQHLGDSGLQLRTLADYKGDDLVLRALALVDELKPMHLSIVGGDPLVRYRELTRLLPELAKRDIHTQVVTSAFREIPASWSEIQKLSISVSVDGLQLEHDARRKPATYDRILKNIAGHRVTVHCTVTGQMMKRPGYLREFVEFWSANPNVKRIWFSIFTPQIGAVSPEILTSAERAAAITDMLALRQEFPKLDMNAAVIRHFANPPRSPQECIFARTTTTISADFKTRVTPCQFGGNPDCSQCGCIASSGLASLGDHKVLLWLSAGAFLFTVHGQYDCRVRDNRAGWILDGEGPCRFAAGILQRRWIGFLFVSGKRKAHAHDRDQHGCRHARDAPGHGTQALWTVLSDDRPVTAAIHPSTQPALGPGNKLLDLAFGHRRKVVDVQIAF